MIRTHIRIAHIASIRTGSPVDSRLGIGTGRAFHKAGPDIEKALDPVLVFIRGATNLFELVERRYFEHFDRTSKSARYADWFSFRVRKVIAHILK